MHTQAESTYIAHNMFGQIEMEIPWYIIRHTLISRRDGKLRMIGGQFVVVRVGVHQQGLQGWPTARDSGCWQLAGETKSTSVEN